MAWVADVAELTYRAGVAAAIAERREAARDLQGRALLDLPASVDVNIGHLTRLVNVLRGRTLGHRSVLLNRTNRDGGVKFATGVSQTLMVASYAAAEGFRRRRGGPGPTAPAPLAPRPVA